MDTKKLREFDPEFAEKLKEAIDTGAAVTVNVDGTNYDLAIAPISMADNDDIWEGYDPERMREALDNVKPIFTEEEARELIENIYKWREAGSRPANRP